MSDIVYVRFFMVCGLLYCMRVSVWDMGCSMLYRLLYFVRALFRYVCRFRVFVMLCGMETVVWYVSF